MKKIIALLFILQMIITGLTSALANKMYVEVAEIVSDAELICYAEMTPDYANSPLDVLTIRLPVSLPEEKLQKILKQRIALVSWVNPFTGGVTIGLDAETIEPAIYYAVVNPWTAYDEASNSIGEAYISGPFFASIQLPETVDVKALVTEGPSRKVIMFAPYPIGTGFHARNIMAKEIFYPTFVCGYVTEFGEDYVIVGTIPYDNIQGATIDSVDPVPMRFALTDATISAHVLQDGVEVVVVYEEETMDAVALFAYHG